MPRPWERRILVMPTSNGLVCLTDCEIGAGNIVRSIHLAQLARRATRDGGRFLVEIVPDGSGWNDPLPEAAPEGGAS